MMGLNLMLTGEAVNIAEFKEVRAQPKLPIGDYCVDIVNVKNGGAKLPEIKKVIKEG